MVEQVTPQPDQAGEELLWYGVRSFEPESQNSPIQTIISLGAFVCCRSYPTLGVYS